MPGLSLAPFAARLHWRRAAPADADQWRDLVVALIGGISENAMARGARLIGHVKGMVPDGARVSSVSAERAPQVSGEFPAGRSELTLDLVVLVYGLERGEVRQAVEQALDGTVTMEVMEAARQATHTRRGRA